jgi:hypothetical protein
LIAVMAKLWMHPSTRPKETLVGSRTWADLWADGPLKTESQLGKLLGLWEKTGIVDYHGI